MCLTVEVCGECGSDRIQYRAWIKTNGGAYIDDCILDQADLWCDNCEEHTEQVEIPYWKYKRKLLLLL